MIFKNYIMRSISLIFFPFFFILIFISSIILIISIATITASIKMEFIDILKLFYYGLPSNIFFVTSITFFASCAIGINKLSYDSEMLILFSLGLAPNLIVKMLLSICIFASLVLFLFAFVMTPLSKSAYKDFLKHKETTVDINIKPGDFGQKLGNWLLYVEGKKNNTYEGLVLYLDKHEVTGNESFIIANNGVISNNNGIMEITLNNGNVYLNDEGNFRNIHFERLVVNNVLNSSQTNSYDLFFYWKKAFEGDIAQERRLSQSIITSLFPISSLFFILFLGVRNPRFQKNKIYLYVLGNVAFYFTMMYFLSMNIPFIGLLLPILWFFTGLYLYKKHISSIY